MINPLVVVNLKTYQQGEESLKLAKMLEGVDKNIIIGAEASDLYRISRETKLQIYCQHVESMSPGRNTGYIIPESAQKNGAIGTFLNHSEHKLNFDVLKETIKRCKEIKLKTIVFASSLSEAIKIEKLAPDYIIYEPPLLVAGDISVSTAKPEIISRIAKKLKTPFLVGAGIKTSADVKKSLELGAIGIAVSSAVTTAKNPERALRELVGI
ncbi:MAG: triose-phosphate isomerase [Nanoarchaeota archaeon]|nr:triose-phosphate isomerase [Nanoarchaeota archaeon]